ncbi:MAG: bifunctional methylenetetrahydrofolate dehydrogenase/methenyltetrahydrofolate cyclohydrolase FolD [SAR202 cluster bacterium]|nr:bifunctional methylenetetrahydrofolate dehydrogenase/methenyltetrahydrofolate cyclohydrolase FolD [SAR202 cluster bacterium]
MMSTIIDGKAIADKLTKSVAEEINLIKKTNSGFVPGLAAVLVGEDPASKVYVRNKKKSATSVGMEALDYYLPESTTQKELEEYVRKLSEDVKIDGILVQLPLPAHIDQEKIINVINPDKDVDGLHPYNVGLLVKGQPRFVPATPAGVQYILSESGIEVVGKHVVICGRSEIVGKPLGLLLIQRNKNANATVTMCHSRTENIRNITKQADVLIVAVGQQNFIKADMVKKGAVIIDVGTNRIQDATRKSGYRLVGDVDFENVKKIASAITPVPGGVGPMTIAMLLKNTLESAKRKNLVFD